MTKPTIGFIGTGRMGAPVLEEWAGVQMRG